MFYEVEAVFQEGKTMRLTGFYTSDLADYAPPQPCAICETDKLPKEFPRFFLYDKIMRNICSSCWGAYRAEADKVTQLLTMAKLRAYARKMPFSLTREDITAHEFCPVLGIRLNYQNKSGKPQNNSPSLDRIDNTKGYVRGNVELISMKANRIKNDGTVDNLANVTEYIRSRLDSVQSEPLSV